MTGLLHDARIAVRFLLRNRGFAIATIGILALGISLTATLYAVVRGALLDPWPYRGYDRLVTIRGNFPTQGRTEFSLWSAPEIGDLRAETRVFEDVIAGDARNVNLTYAGRPERVRAAIITPVAFALLDVPALLGRTLSEADAAPGAVPAVLISYRFWQTRLGGDPAIVGRTLRVSDVAYTVVGVMPQRFVFWDRDLWMPLLLDPSDARIDRRYYVQGMLRRGVSLAAASADLRAFMARLTAEHPERPEYAGSSIAIGFLVEDVLRDLRPTLYLLLAAVAMVLLVAIANLANATLAKGLSREGELAIRRAIGGTSGQLARQLLVETSLVGVAGGLVGAAAAAFLLPQILALIPFGYVPAEANVVLDWRIVAAATAAATACGIAIGLVPAIRASHVNPAIALRRADARTGSVRTHRYRDLFVSAQLTLAVVVVGVAVAATATLRTAVVRDPGYRAAGVWTAHIALASTASDADRAAAVYDRILQRLNEQSAVKAAAIASLFPVGEQPSVLVSPERAEGVRRLATLDAASLAVSPEFFLLLRMPLLDGRAFTGADDRGHASVAIVSRSLARRLWPDGRVLGSRVVLGDSGSTTATVVGVVGDVATGGPETATRPAIFFPLAQRPPGAAMIGVRMDDNRSALAVVTESVRSVDAGIPLYSPDTLERQQLAVLGPRLLAVTLLGLFAATVLVLSSVGIHAVVSQSVQERRQELQIRLAFGAAPARLFRREMMRTAALAVVSALIGSAAAAAALRALTASFAGFAGAAGLTIAASAGLVVALALLATASPAWRACRVS
jgi:putative ABC transport system permease protein